MNQEKSDFLSRDLFVHLQHLQESAPANWGRMNARQMVEHLRDFFNVSIEKLKFDQVTPEEDLPKYRAFLLSDKEFRENTKAPGSVLGDEPLPMRFASLEVAIQKLQLTVDSFARFFETDAEKKTLHPVFGWLNYEDWILLHYKHVRHHLKQFNLLPATI